MAPSPAARRRLLPEERRFLALQRVARLATADSGGQPHVVPVCFALAGDSLYVAIDGKPKRVPGARLKRLANIAENPRVAVVADRYDDDWRRLGWVMLRGQAEILEFGREHDEAQKRLRGRYPQYATMLLRDQPVIAVRIARVASWGDLAPEGGPA